MQKALQIIVLAAGKGTRMNSDLPKVLHPILGKPMLYHVVRACLQLKPQKIVVVTGYESEQVATAMRKLYPVETKSGHISFALQHEQCGTGDAVWSARHSLLSQDEGVTLITIGDAPLVTTATLDAARNRLEEAGATIAVVSFVPDNPTGYGRIVKNADGNVTAIVEERDATAAQKMITECSSGIFAVSTMKLLSYLTPVMQEKTNHEYYLTDIVLHAVAAGDRVVTAQTQDGRACLGINTTAQLAEAEALISAQAK